MKTNRKPKEKKTHFQRRYVENSVTHVKQT